MHYEPQRYHYITFSLFYKFLTNQDFSKKDDLLKASGESVFALAADLNKKKKKRNGSSEGGLYSSKSDMMD